MSDNHPLEMSDEDFLNIDEASYTDFSEEESVESEVENEEPSLEQDHTEETPEEEESLVDETETDDDLEEDEAEESEPESTEEASDERDYKAEVEKLLAPFKANGREIQVDSVDDAIALMQQGINYNHKMAALKPIRRIAKMLENNGLLDENKLNRLIDIEKGNPQAIKQLIKQSKLDLDEYDPEEETEYSPSNYSSSEQEVELDDVIERIKHSPAYEQTTNVITKLWDDASKQKLAKSPQLIETLNHQISLGIYDRVATQVAKEQALGRLNNLSDFDAYTQIGERMLADGAFDDISKPTPQAAKPVSNESKKAKEAERARRKKAVKPTKSAKPKSQSMDFNPLALSDEEFEKIAMSKYL